MRRRVPREQKTFIMTIRLSPEIWEILEVLSEREAIPKSTLVRSLLTKMLRDEKGLMVPRVTEDTS